MFKINPSIVAKNVDIDKSTPLCDIMKKYGTDKVYNPERIKDLHSSHNFTVFYDALFSPIRYEKFNLFEIGIGSLDEHVLSHMEPNNGFRPGDSLRAWKEYFPNAQIYGGDVDEKILFNDEDRIHTYYFNQICSKCIYEFKTKLVNDTGGIPIKFDIIIDDGLHIFEANFVSFQNMYDLLNPGGVYIIEDALPSTIEHFKSENITFQPDIKVLVLEIEFKPNTVNSNNLIVLWRKP